MSDSGSQAGGGQMRTEFRKERLAWAKMSTDPRIAAGQQSPLEKKILNLGGVRTTAARQLVAQKYQEEHETLRREQALSLDYWLAQAESYYNKRIVEMGGQETGCEMKKKLEGETTQNLERQKQYHMVPAREGRHLGRRVQRAGQAREVQNKPRRPRPQAPGETTVPRIVPERQSILSAQKIKPLSEREQAQTEAHQERMLQGRALGEQRLEEGGLRRARSRGRRGRAESEVREFEHVTAYPLLQPRGRSRIKVNVLVEKNREEGNTVIKPHQRRYLTVPPYMRSQIGKIKGIKFQCF
ncbi:putative uncharacterized protein ZNRD1-AS1 isoform X2 [Suricata suricatta]|uniref:Uncharacterized protein n=1 Tax=Suricata suricatta TaxID=37032 RepID=A0A673T4N5_SURSU|nr:putative uncharacterized protein ZNRD1-AS1 isoform X2 [Suricata suricatta]